MHDVFLKQIVSPSFSMRLDIYQAVAALPVYCAALLSCYCAVTGREYATNAHQRRPCSVT